VKKSSEKSESSVMRVYSKSVRCEMTWCMMISRGHDGWRWSEECVCEWGSEWVSEWVSNVKEFIKSSHHYITSHSLLSSQAAARSRSTCTGRSDCTHPPPTTQLSNWIIPIFPWVPWVSWTAIIKWKKLYQKHFKFAESVFVELVRKEEKKKRIENNLIFDELFNCLA
jgi:hypothetical protein